MKYRAEIDGLRAIAVIPVILFHAGFEVFSGGYVGVDIFFVISGYLITTIILSEKEKNTFSLVNFYDRRARRILPALFLVMFISLPFAWFWLLPADLKDFSQSLVAVSTFSSNILFWQETGYWGVENELKPLLHTWSLAVEEQYYIIFPLYLLLMWRFRKRWIFASFLIFAIISLFLSQWAAYAYPTANFFLLPTRAWELAIGASIAFYSLYKKPTTKNLTNNNRRLNEIMGLTGIGLIIYSIFIYNETTPFPSLYALVPTVGTALIIVFSSSKTFVGKALCYKPLVGIGLISYSAYLWHQPLFSFSRHRSLTEPSENMFLILIGLTFILAYISWRYIEKPFRTKGVFSRKFIFLFWIIGSTFFIIIGVSGHITKGFNDVSFKKQYNHKAVEDKLSPNFGLSKECEGSFTLSSNCRTSNEPNILIWGDSYAMHLVPGIQASHKNAKIIQMTKSACGAFFDIAPVYQSNQYPANNCLEFNKQVHNWIKENKSIKYVVISTHFNNYLTKNNKLAFRNGDIINSNTNIVMQQFLNTLNQLESLGVIPVIFSSPPANGFDLGRCLAKAERMNLSLDECNFSLNDMSEDRENEYLFLDQLDKRVKIIRLDKLLCNSSQQCNVHLDSTWLFRDDAHLSSSGSTLLGEKHKFHDLITLPEL